MCLLVCLFFCLFVCLFVCLSICLFFSLSVPKGVGGYCSMRGPDPIKRQFLCTYWTDLSKILNLRCQHNLWPPFKFWGWSMHVHPRKSPKHECVRLELLRARTSENLYGGHNKCCHLKFKIWERSVQWLQRNQRFIGYGPLTLWWISKAHAHANTQYTCTVSVHCTGVWSGDREPIRGKHVTNESQPCARLV